MKVDIKTGDRTTGMVFKKTYPTVTLKVEFTEEEKAIIKQNRLEDVIVIERDCPADRDAAKSYDGQWNVRVSSLLYSEKSGLEHVGRSNGEIKGFIDQAKENLPKLKAMIEGNATEAEDESFEL